MGLTEVPFDAPKGGEVADVALGGGVANGKGPGTHALIVGVSHYPYLSGNQATADGSPYGLEDLTSAARSASEVMAWLLNEYRNPDAPLASLQVLLSPGAGEGLADGMAARLPGPCPATRDAVEHDYLMLRDRLRDQPRNVGFVYIAAHGIQLTPRGAIVLLEDFAVAGRVDLYGAMDVVGCHDGLDGDGFARNQFWFLDACRQVPEIARLFENLEAGVLSSKTAIGLTEPRPMFLASAPRDVAFADPDGTTLFSQALLAALRGDAAVGPDSVQDQGQGWHVPAGWLLEIIKKEVTALAIAGGEEQFVQPLGYFGEAVIHHLERAPDVPIVLSLDPPQAKEQTKVSLWFNGDISKKSVDSVAEWPLERTLPAGLYQLWVEPSAPYHRESRFVEVKPREFRDEITLK